MEDTAFCVPYSANLNKFLKPGSLEDVLRRWQEPHRAFHTLAHLQSILISVDPSRVALVLAAFYHDAVYNPKPAKPKENEQQSAALLLSQAQPSPIIDKAVAIIRSTGSFCHKSDPLEEEFFTLDCQALLGDQEALAVYEQQIRKEFACFPVQDYVKGRAEFLLEASAQFPENKANLLQLRQQVLASLNTPTLE